MVKNFYKRVNGQTTAGTVELVPPCPAGFVRDVRNIYAEDKPAAGVDGDITIIFLDAVGVGTATLTGQRTMAQGALNVPVTRIHYDQKVVLYPGESLAVSAVTGAGDMSASYRDVPLKEVDDQ